MFWAEFTWLMFYIQVAGHNLMQSNKRTLFQTSQFNSFVIFKVFKSEFECIDRFRGKNYGVLSFLREQEKNARTWQHLVKWHSTPLKLGLGYVKSVSKDWFMISMPPHTPELSYVVFQLPLYCDMKFETLYEVTRETQREKSKVHCSIWQSTKVTWYFL